MVAASWPVCPLWSCGDLDIVSQPCGLVELTLVYVWSIHCLINQGVCSVIVLNVLHDVDFSAHRFSPMIACWRLTQTIMWNLITILQKTFLVLNQLVFQLFYIAVGICLFKFIWLLMLVPDIMTTCDMLLSIAYFVFYNCSGSRLKQVIGSKWTNLDGVQVSRRRWAGWFRW